MSSSHSSIKNALTLQACFLLASIVSGIGTGFAEAQDREERNPLALQAPLFKYAELKDLDLMNLDGAPISWKDSSRLRVYAFLGCDCPVAKLYGRRIEELQARYSNPSNPGDSIEWVGVMSSPQDTVEDIRHFARELHLEFPFVRDADQAIASRLRVSRTAEVILVNRKNEVIYRGRIDDQYAPGVTKSKVAREDLANAIDAALRGETPEIAITEPVGCRISFDRKPATAEASNSMAAMFADSIVPIFNKHCTECHRPGEIGPFDITDRSEIQGWSEMILEVLDNGRMPPWHADPNHGSFKNARAISREEIETVRQWVRAGAPLGELAHLG